MPQHHNKLHITTPIIELLLAREPHKELVDAVATCLISEVARPTWAEALTSAQMLLTAVRTGLQKPGRVTFSEYANESGDYPSCVVVLAHGDISARLWARVDMRTHTGRLVPMPKDTTSTLH